MMSEHDVTSLRSISSDVTAHPADPSTVKVLSYIVTLFLFLLIKHRYDDAQTSQRPSAQRSEVSSGLWEDDLEHLLLLRWLRPAAARHPSSLALRETT